MDKQREQFEAWWDSAPHRAKYSADHPAVLAGWEAWQAAQAAPGEAVYQWSRLEIADYGQTPAQEAWSDWKDVDEETYRQCSGINRTTERWRVLYTRPTDAAAIERDAFEQAAKMCDAEAAKWKSVDYRYAESAALNSAEAIRALAKDQS